MEAFGKCLPDRKVLYMYMHTVPSGKELDDLGPSCFATSV